jgi:hypothetical protein
LGGSPQLASNTAGSGRGAWRIAWSKACSVGLSNAYFKLLGRPSNRLKALYRSWAIPCAGTQVYALCHRSEGLSKITEAGVRRRAEHYHQQLDALQTWRREVRKDLLLESRKHNATKLLRQVGWKSVKFGLAFTGT